MVDVVLIFVAVYIEATVVVDVVDNVVIFVNVVVVVLFVVTDHIIFS